MKRILTALVLIPLVLLLVFKAPLWAIAVVTCAVALLAQWEFLSIIRGYGADVQIVVPCTATFYLFALLFFPHEPQLYGPIAQLYGLGPWPILMLAPATLLTVAFRKPVLQSAAVGAIASMFSVMYIGVPLYAVFVIRQTLDGVFWLLVLFASVWAGDTLAMYVGKSVGRHKLAPIISPKKTWEGSIASVLGSVVAVLIVFHFRPGIWRTGRHFLPEGYAIAPGGSPPPIAVSTVVALAIILNIAGQLGDLAESVIKRGANVKDSGTLLPGHGGILDRIDALLFAAPVLWYYLAIFRS
jgi:phosphatidate cytidylyltransferase